MFKWLATAVLALWVPNLLAETPAEAVALAHADARRLPPNAAQYVRYFWRGNLPDKEWEADVQALSYWCNSLSRTSEIFRPVAVSASLLRINLEDYGWNTSTWEKLADLDPYFHTDTVVEFTKYWSGGNYQGKYYGAGYYKEKSVQRAFNPRGAVREGTELVSITQSKCPIVRADWWFTQTVRQLSLRNREQGVGYYDWLGIKNRNDFFELIQLDEKKSLKFAGDVRAAIERSGVATQNRQVVRLRALGGGHWATLDTDDSTGDGNALERLKRGEFVHKAEEHYAVLSNGLFAYLLCDAKGKLQSSAPDFIGADDSPLRTGRDGRIHVGLSCVRCHVEGLRPINDWVRKTLRRPLALQSPDYKEYAELRRQYFSDLERYLARDRLVFEEAVFACNGLKVVDNARAVARFWDSYVERDYGLVEVAALYGVTAQVLLQSLRGYVKVVGSVPSTFAGLLQEPPVGARIEKLEENYEQGWNILNGQIPLEKHP